MRLLPLVIAASLAALAAADRPARAPAHGVPPLLFAARRPLPEGAGAVPGLGPRHRAAAAGGRLMVFDPARGVRPVEGVPEGALFDVSDPAVAPDGRRVAFAGLAHPEGGWRIHLLLGDGADRRLAPAPVPRDAAAARYDDLDPCWLDDSTLVFASTRDGDRSQYDGTPVPQLFRLDLRDGRLHRLTAERNGAAEPCVDPRTGRIVYSRWWFNRARPGGAPGDTVNFWQAVSIAPDGGDPRAIAAVAGGRRPAALHQPAIAPDGSLFGVAGDALGLSPAAGACEVTWRPRAQAAPRHVAGASFDPEDAPRYGSTRGLASPSACAPAPLGDGRVVFSLDPGGRGDFGLWIARRDGGGLAPLVDLEGTLELDAVPWVARRAKRAPPPAFSLEPIPRDAAALAARTQRFRYLNRGVFAAGFGERETARARAAGPLRLRFWAALPRAGAPPFDTLVLVREVPVGADGRVDERGLPAGVPMFEQLVDAAGHVLRSAHGPAHVAGYNAGVPGGTSRCAGCHAGHSAKR